jgi:predicted permease
MTIRLALGAGRGRLLRLLFVEGIVMLGLASAGGLLAADWCRNLLVLFFPPQGVQLNLAAEIDLRVLAFNAAVCIVAALAFGLFPAIQNSKLDIVAGLKAEAAGVVGSERRRSRIRSTLVLAQVALCFVLLVGEGLFFRSLLGMQRESPGFSTQEVLNASIDLFAAGYDEARGKSFQDELISRIESRPGVESAAFARVPPFSYRGYSTGPILVEGYQPRSDEVPSAEYNEVGPAYFATLGIPLIAGREFTRQDNETALPVTVINQSFAARYWPGQDAVGKRLQLKGHWLQVVGVAHDAKYRSFMEGSKAFLYVPLRQAYSGQVMLHIRTRQAPEALATILAYEVHSLDANLAPSAVITMKQQVDSSTSAQQIAVTLLGVFGGLALLLAAIGLYGTMSYAVSQRMREFGLRVALGAETSDVVLLVVSLGVTPALGGVLIGSIASFELTRLVAPLLYKVNPRDIASFALAVIVMLVVSAVAYILPAWRAMRLDPARVLRQS